MRAATATVKQDAQGTPQAARAKQVALLTQIEARLRWLSSWTIHNANNLREKRDGLKVGGHQASCASITAVMTALYFHALRRQDKVAVNPHAEPVLHAIHYLLGEQAREKPERFRGLGSVQSLSEPHQRHDPRRLLDRLDGPRSGGDRLHQPRAGLPDRARGHSPRRTPTGFSAASTTSSRRAAGGWWR